ncbi:MAG: hypothetical protein GQ477_04380 [Nanohaloarchaea archaeon]|nr:hypothetical protein [Candidatus Nanohaloarchaea archaeon]
MVVCNYEYDNENNTIRVNCLNCIYGSSVEDFPICMARTIDKLVESKNAARIILTQTREFEYDMYQTHLLKQIANTIVYLVKQQRILSVANLSIPTCNSCVPQRNEFLHRLLTTDIREDPISTYVKVIREIRHIHERMKNSSEKCMPCYQSYIINVLEKIKSALEATELINIVKTRLVGHVDGNRTLYREIFHPMIKPNFMLTRYMLNPPKKGKKIDRYMVGTSEVQIFKVEDKIQKIYHIIPPEFRLGEEEYTILDAARRYMAAHKPTKTEFADPQRMRDIFSDIGRDLISELADHANITLTTKTLNILADILTRYTAGYGVLEVILGDENVQDIYLNAPMGDSPIYLYHGDHEECITNIIPTKEDANAWATRFRIESGRPLDEANPVLDTEIVLPSGRARVAAITRSLSPDGLSFVLRRHRDKPWTYPLFIHYNMMTPLSAGLLSFMIDGARTMMFAGTRSAGKSSLLGATLTELMKKVRIITVEDTLELPVKALKKLGYDVQSLKSRSIITHVESELSADDAIRTSLRLGDSSLIVGEVRSVEAKALYESMRIGALANLVAGTIHGDSPYGVFDRVVNDLGVPPTSFKATDIITVVNRLKSADGLKTYRRIMEITEVTKDWDENPQKEHAFQPLMMYDSKKDRLEPTDRFLNGESLILNSIADRVKDWKNNWDAVWENIQLRTNMKEALVKYAHTTNDLSILEADFTTQANSRFHIVSEEVKEQYGSLDPERIYGRWDEWVKRKIKEKQRLMKG